ncbi:MAG TPA: pirin family protein [Sandaracinaceae bacterium LLY-WYZ-13_1]|nr:pirin family protein [Sandaracinaceae bacterium LLY-WYZ-13_1]
MTRSSRSVAGVVTAHRQLEGGGFPVRRPFPAAGLELLDPFLLLDEMGPVVWEPGEAIGAPDHPHRGFETVTYVLEGHVHHEDSAGHEGTIGPGDVQWMTAGAGVVHSEMPNAELKRDGGPMHGFQLWVNLPREHKMRAPRYQEIPRARIPVAESDDGRVTARVIAGRALGAEAVIDTHIPITFLHLTVRPGGALVQPLERSLAGFVYVFAGAGEVGDAAVADGRMAVLRHDRDEVRVAVPEDADAPLEALLIAGEPIREPVARYGPFVMNTKEEIFEAIRDFQAGRLGRIAREAR